MELRHLSPSELERARPLLVANDLPVADLDDPANELFGAFDAGDLIGVVGLQRCDGVGLLRSLAVASSRRTAGIGRALCDHVLDIAREHGFGAVYLMTTGAADYFAGLGFTPVERADAPASIRTTAQFASLCPASAKILRRSI